MPVVPADILEGLRSIYNDNIHNTAARVNKITSTTVEDNNPGYISDETNNLTTYIGFTCSVYNMLSGKINRLFETRDIPVVLAELGRTEEKILVVQYVPDQYIQDEATVLPDVLNNLVVDEEVEIENKWWKVRKVIADSEGVQQTALVVQ